MFEPVSSGGVQKLPVTLSCTEKEARAEEADRLWRAVCEAVRLFKLTHRSHP